MVSCVCVCFVDINIEPREKFFLAFALYSMEKKYLFALLITFV